MEHLITQLFKAGPQTHSRHSFRARAHGYKEIFNYSGAPTWGFPPAVMLWDKFYTNPPTVPVGYPRPELIVSAWFRQAQSDKITFFSWFLSLLSCVEIFIFNFKGRQSQKLMNERERQKRARNDVRSLHFEGQSLSLNLERDEMHTKHVVSAKTLKSVNKRRLHNNLIWISSRNSMRRHFNGRNKEHSSTLTLTFLQDDLNSCAWKSLNLCVKPGSHSIRKKWLLTNCVWCFRWSQICCSSKRHTVHALSVYILKHPQ